MIFIAVAVFIMIFIEAVIIIPDKMPFINSIRKKVKKRDRSSESG